MFLLTVLRNTIYIYVGFIQVNIYIYNIHVLNLTFHVVSILETQFSFLFVSIHLYLEI